MSDLKIHQFPCRSDNYGVLIHDPATNETGSIDAPDATAVRAALKQNGWSLTHIFVTHHHQDHTGGNLELKSETGCTIVGPEAEKDKVPGIDRAVREGDRAEFGNYELRVFDTPGHTKGHISYWIKDAGVAFVGDTLFAMGCGRLFEGNAKMMWGSLQKLMSLPPETTVYCGHEYTAANAQFALTVDPDNQALQARCEDVRKKRENNEPTLPTRMDLELSTNPFLRASDPQIRKGLNMENAEDWQVFAEIRQRKDNA